MEENFTQTPVANLKQHTTTPQVQIINENFDIPQLGIQRRVWLYLPDNYIATDIHYPVIYMQDGQNLFDEATASYAEWRVDEFLESLPDDKQCIVVGVDHGAENRIIEYNPFDSKQGDGRGNNYADFLVQTLKPFIDENYRTLPRPQHTVIAGSSMGGLISMFVAIKYPEVFGQAGVFSPAFWIAPDIYEYAKKSNITEHSRFCFICGDDESESMVGDVQRMAEIIRAKDISEADSPVTVIKGAKHDEQQWQGDFPAFYSWLYNSF